jgi:hypothetical protein
MVGAIPFLNKEGSGVVDRLATTPYPLLLGRRGVIFRVVHTTPQDLEQQLQRELD